MLGNIIGEYLDYVYESIFDIFKILLSNKYNKHIVEPFIKKFIDVRYYNITSYPKEKNFITKLRNELVDVAKELTKIYPKDLELIKNVCGLFGYIVYIDDCIICDNYSILVDTLMNDDDFSLDFHDKKKELKSKVLEFTNKKDEFFKLMDNSDFDLKEKRVGKCLYEVDIIQNCKISKLYSDYAIMKAFNTEVIKEDKIYVMYILVAMQILKNAYGLDFSRNYIVEFPRSLFEKSRKIVRYINLLKNELVKEHISLKIDYDTYLKFKSQTKEYIKSGIKFALVLDDKFDDNYENLIIFDYIILYKNSDNYEDIINKLKDRDLNIISI